MPSVSAAQVVESFFDAYRAHDVERMVELCDDQARFRSVPFEICRKQRVVKGSGHVGTIGKLLWTGLIDAFPDLTNEVTSIISGRDPGPYSRTYLPVATPLGVPRQRSRQNRQDHLLL